MRVMFPDMDSDNDKPGQLRKRFDPFARPFDWYRLPLAIKLAVISLWRVEQDPSKPDHEATKDLSPYVCLYLGSADGVQRT